MDTQCADSSISEAEGTCDAYAPKQQLPGDQLVPDAAEKAGNGGKGGPAGRCPFQAVNITDQELQPAKLACGGYRSNVPKSGP
jgi:hypothetical protein